MQPWGGTCHSLHVHLLRYVGCRQPCSRLTSLYVCVCACVCAYFGVFHNVSCVCMISVCEMCMYACVCVCMYVCVCACMCVSVCMCVCVCMCVFVRVAGMRSRVSDPPTSRCCVVWWLRCREVAALAAHGAVVELVPVSCNAVIAFEASDAVLAFVHVSERGGNERGPTYFIFPPTWTHMPLQHFNTTRCTTPHSFPTARWQVTDPTHIPPPSRTHTPTTLGPT